MAITYIPREQKTALESFREGMSPYLQMAFQAMMQKKLQEQQRQQGMQQAQQMFPEAFIPDYESAVRGQKGGYVDLAPNYQPTPEMWKQMYQEQTRKTTVPSQYMKFSSEKAPIGFQMRFNEQGIPQFGYEKPQPDIFTKLAMFNEMKGNQGQIELPSTSREEAINKLKESGENPKQYTIKETVKSISGVPITTYSVEKRAARLLPSAQLKAIEDTQATLNNLYRIKQKAPQFQTGPFEYRFDPNIPFNQKIMALRGKPGEAGYKSDITDTQATYLSAKTGAQRGFREIQWMEPAMPSANMPPNKMVEVTDSAIVRMEQNLQNLINVAKKSGYDVSQFETEKQPQQFDFSKMSTEELLRRKQQLLQGGGR